MNPEEIEALIVSKIPDAKVSITDLRGDGDHFAAHIISNVFEGKTKVQQHQIIYQALQGKIGNELHALAIQTSTPEN